MHRYNVKFSAENISGERYMRQENIYADNARDARAIIKIRRPDARKIVIARI